jgi:hypothetical protein
MCKNIKTGGKTGKKRALAVDKNMLSRLGSGWTYRVYNQDAGFSHNWWNSSLRRRKHGKEN